MEGSLRRTACSSFLPGLRERGDGGIIDGPKGCGQHVAFFKRRSLPSARIVGFTVPPLAPPIADGRGDVLRAQLGELLGRAQDLAGTRAAADEEIGLRRMTGDRHKARIVDAQPRGAASPGRRLIFALVGSAALW